jgi:hypothetical protein
VVELIVRRPRPGEREVVALGRLDVSAGLVGDCWMSRPSPHTADGAPHLNMQLNVMNCRAMRLFAPEKSSWAMSGDQLFIDLDLSVANLPPGALLAVGGAIITVTDQVHRTCRGFARRYGTAAARFVESPEGRSLRLRGVNARVVRSGDVKVGDRVWKLSSA